VTAYLTAMAVSAGIYALLALGVNLTWGMAGMVNLGLAGFFAVGGYATALLTKAGVAIPLGIASGAIAAAVTGAGVALLTARLRADYLAIVTLGFSESVRIAAANEIWLTNGSDGIACIPGPWRGTLTPLQFNLLFLGAVLIVVLLEGTRFTAPFLPFLVPAQIAAVRELLVSVLLLAVLRILPDGIIPERPGTSAAS
jgi:branched-chain amino acid transport system permease protein